MNKSEIRSAVLKQRKSMSGAAVEALSIKLMEQFSRLDFSGINIIHIFLPIAEKNEPDTFLIIEWLKKHHSHIRIIVPKADFDTALMTSHYFDGHEDLKRNAYNILEPQAAAMHTGAIDMVIIPLLAFDQNGYRVGYGKGFYDRFLQGISTKKIGLSFFEEPVEIDDVNEYDIRMDKCITPEQIFTFPLK